MKQYEKVIHSTRIDAHDDVISKEELENMAAGMAGKCILISYQHDPRHPPIGRIAATRLIQSEDGEYDLLGTLEIWESDDNMGRFDRSDLRIQKDIDDYKPTLLYDRSFLNPEDKQLISEITAMGFESDQIIKKALEPLSSIVIYGVAIYLLGRAAGGFVDGFSKQLGQDTAVKLEKAIKDLLKRRKDGTRLVVLKVPIIEGDSVREIELILENTSDIEYFFNHDLDYLSKMILEVVRSEPETVEIVIKWKGRKPSILYTIRNNGIPSAIEPISENELDSMSLSIEGSAQRIKY